jgi:hypothetical protein
VKDYIGTLATVAAIRATTVNELLLPEANRTVAAIASFDLNQYFINKIHSLWPILQHFAENYHRSMKPFKISPD